MKNQKGQQRNSNYIYSSFPIYSSFVSIPQNENLTFHPQITNNTKNLMKKNDDFLTRLEKDQISRADKTLA